MRLERDRWMQRGDQGVKTIMAKASRKEDVSADEDESPIKIAKFDVQQAIKIKFGNPLNNSLAAL
jgi:hypothetical protein